MITFSDTMPLSLLPLGDGNYHYNYNITTEEVTEKPFEEGAESTTRTQYVFDTVFINGTPTVAKIVNAVVREHYSEDEIQLMNAQHQAALLGLDEEPQGYSTYLALVVQARAEATTAMSNFVLEEK